MLKSRIATVTVTFYISAGGGVTVPVGVAPDVPWGDHTQLHPAFQAVIYTLQIMGGRFRLDGSTDERVVPTDTGVPYAVCYPIVI